METFINCIDAVRGDNPINLLIFDAVRGVHDKYMQLNFDAQ